MNEITDLHAHKHGRTEDEPVGLRIAEDAHDREDYGDCVDPTILRPDPVSALIILAGTFTLGALAGLVLAGRGKRGGGRPCGTR